MYICIYVYMYICIYVYMYICIYVYIYICIYVYMYICICICTCICVYLYVYNTLWLYSLVLQSEPLTVQKELRNRALITLRLPHVRVVTRDIDKGPYDQDRSLTF